MVKKEHLFYLINSLSKSEKRYFKIFCFNKDKTNNYLQLFNEIEKQDIYNEDLIRIRFKDQSFIKQLHVTKNYLRQLILASLRSYHQKSSREMEVRNILNNIEILFNKELYDLCQNEIQRADKIIQEFGLQVQELDLISWKRKLLLLKHKITSPDIKILLMQEAEAIKAKGQINNLWNALADVFNYANDEDQFFLKKYKLKESESDQTAKVMRHNLLYIYNVINGREKEGLDNLQNSIDHQELFPHRIKENPEPYLTAINNKLSYLIRLREYEKAFPLSEQIRQTVTRFNLKESKFTYRMIVRSFNLELEMLRDSKQYEEGIVLIEKIKDFLNTHRDLLSTEYRVLLYFQFTSIYFNAEKYLEALHWAQEMFAIKAYSARIELQGYTRILNLMIHFELKNTMVLKFAVENTRRFLKKHRKKQAFEDIMLRFFSKISKTPTAEYKEVFLQLYKKLFQGEVLIVNEDIADSIDIENWISKNIGPRSTS